MVFILLTVICVEVVNRVEVYSVSKLAFCRSLRDDEVVTGVEVALLSNLSWCRTCPRVEVASLVRSCTLPP